MIPAVGRDDAGNIILDQQTNVSQTLARYDPRLGILNQTSSIVRDDLSERVTTFTRTTADADIDTLAAQPPLPEDPGAAGPGGGGGGGGGCASGQTPRWPWLAFTAMLWAGTACRRRRRFVSLAQ
ncbi:MAG: hypothetical protein ACI9MR_005148 [Myxococcota bacterium]